jgi:hypothetical protein
MKRIFFSVAALTVTLFANCQMLTPTVIASTGGFSSNANGSLSYTVGEMTMVQTFSASGNILTQGFQQPNSLPTGLIELSQEDFGSFVVYPNPAVDAAFFGFQFPEQGKVSVILYNTLGQKLSDVFNTNYSTGNAIQTLNTSLLASGMYFLTLNFVSDLNGKEKTMSRKLQVIR